MAHLENAYLINIKQNAKDVKEQIKKHGAVGVMYMHSDNAMKWSENVSRYTYYDTNENGGGHAVMIVGWDDNFSRDNFEGESKPTNNGAWLIRNSWGTYCNYFWMSYESASLVDTAWVFDFSKSDDYDNNYQYDGGISVYPNSNTTLANVYTVSEKDGVDSETLKAVSISMTRAANVKYTIEVYTDLYYGNRPTSGTKQEEATTTGTTSYAGIYTIPLKKEVQLEPGSKFSVVVSVDKAAVDCEQATTEVNGDKMVWECKVSEANQKSYYKSGNSFAQWIYGNFCIKAFTSNNKNYSISYELNGGTNNSENPVSYATGNDAIALKDPTREGYTFVGWFTDSEYKNQITEIPENSTEDFTLYAKWRENTSIGESLSEYSISMNGTIGMNFYMELDQELLNDPNAYMEFRLPNGTVKKETIKEATKKNGKFVFSCDVSAKEMTADIEAQMISGNKAGTVYKHSVKDYTDYILEHADDFDSTVVNVVKKMVNYGAASQIFFDYRTENLANQNLNEEDKKSEVADFTPYKYTVTENTEKKDIQYYASSLILNAEPVIKHYFELSDGANIDDYTFKCKLEGTETPIIVAPKKATNLGDQYYYIETKNTRAYDLDKNVAITVCKADNTVIELNYGVFSYGCSLAEQTDKNQQVVDIMNAMYEYWEKAKEYVDHVSKK